jgi:hypothetical protein
MKKKNDKINILTNTSIMISLAGQALGCLPISAHKCLFGRYMTNEFDSMKQTFTPVRLPESICGAAQHIQ